MCVLRLYRATPGWGVRRGCVCLSSGSGCAPPLLAGVLGCVCLCARSACTLPLLAGVCGVGVCVWAQVSDAPRHSSLGCWGACVFVCALRLYPATPGWAVRCGCVCLGSCMFGCAPPFLAGVFGGVCVCVRAPLIPRHSWQGCAVWVFVFGLGFWLRRATRGWGNGLCVCLCARYACTPSLLAWVCGVGLCVSAGVSSAFCQSLLGCRGPCVFLCALRLYPATPCWGVRCACVCLGSGFGCASPLLAGLSGCVCVCVCPPLVPRHSWLGCPAWVCVFRLGFQLRPATPCWGVRSCVCVRVRALLEPRHSWLECAVWVCVFGLGLWLRSATPRWGVGCVCVFVCVLRLYPATPRWGVRCGCVCLRLGFGCAPPLVAGVLGFMCVFVRAPLAPRHSWLGCAV